ncbi:MAG TPA: DUF1329 domain-containing protein [Candidatus Binataceae bacterium]|nr:DUF1329 domain-containing protein [Candidatus Binataceae bacterium]
MTVKLVRFVAFLLALGLIFATTTKAQTQSIPPSTFSIDPYNALVPADSSRTIPQGTKITLQNWRDYKGFLPVSLQALYSGAYPWHVGPGPDYTVEVGPTIHQLLPRRYVEDTEKYSNQVRLEKVPSGGYTVTGYVAGLPFPNPAEPQMGYKIFYNTFFSANPAIFFYRSLGFTVDRFGNSSGSDADVISYEVNHISDPSYPISPPYGKGWVRSGRIYLRQPEQSKYLTEITLSHDDPAQIGELYVFIPSLRRPLRLSSSARCAPIAGGDFVNDDFFSGCNFQAPEFNLKYLGTKKVLSLFHMDQVKAREVNNYADGTSTLPSWPKPLLGKWELRDAYVVDVTPLPTQPGYCYGHKVIYFDKETFIPLWLDIYDRDEKLWKAFMTFSSPVPTPSGEEVYILGVNTETMVELQNKHLQISVVSGPVSIDKDVSAEYRNVQLMAFPGSLSQVMQ